MQTARIMRPPADTGGGRPENRYLPWTLATAFGHRAEIGRGFGALLAIAGGVATSSIACLLVLLVLYAALVVLTGLLDTSWSHGPQGPTPPETYS